MKKNFRLEHKLKTARNYLGQGKHLHAIQVYHHLIKEMPEFTEAYFYLSDIYESVHRIEAAYNLLSHLLEKEPDNNDARLYFGQFLLRNAFWNEAVEILSPISPDEEPVVNFFLGYSYYMLEDYELAKHDFINYINSKDNDELAQEANVYLSKIDIELNNYNEALKHAKRAELLYGNFWELHLIYAICYYNLSMFEHAVCPIETAIKLNPDEPKSYEWAGKIYLKTGKYLKAEKNFKKFVEMVEELSSDIYLQLAEACMKNKHVKDAVNYFSVALKIDPKNKSAEEGYKSAASLLNKNMVSDG